MTQSGTQCTIANAHQRHGNDGTQHNDLQRYERANERAYPAVARLSLAQFGNDIDYLVRRIDALLAQAFDKQPSTIPLPVLAQSLAGIYSWVLQAWLNGQSSMTGEEVAAYLQRLVSATIKEALGVTQE